MKNQLLTLHYNYEFIKFIFNFYINNWHLQSITLEKKNPNPLMKRAWESPPVTPCAANSCSRIYNTWLLLEISFFQFTKSIYRKWIIELQADQVVHYYAKDHGTEEMGVTEAYVVGVGGDGFYVERVQRH